MLVSSVRELICNCIGTIEKGNTKKSEYDKVIEEGLGLIGSKGNLELWD